MFMEDEELSLDPYMNYDAVEGISNEIKERLGKVRPISVVSLVFSGNERDVGIHLTDYHSGSCEAHGRDDSCVYCCFTETREKNSPEDSDFEPLLIKRRP